MNLVDLGYREALDVVATPGKQPDHAGQDTRLVGHEHGDGMPLYRHLGWFQLNSPGAPHRTGRAPMTAITTMTATLGGRSRGARVPATARLRRAPCPLPMSCARPGLQIGRAHV